MMAVTLSSSRPAALPAPRLPDDQCGPRESALLYTRLAPEIPAQYEIKNAPSSMLNELCPRRSDISARSASLRETFKMLTSSPVWLGPSQVLDFILFHLFSPSPNARPLFAKRTSLTGHLTRGGVGNSTWSSVQFSWHLACYGWRVQFTSSYSHLSTTKSGVNLLMGDPFSYFF